MLCVAALRSQFEADSVEISSHPLCIENTTSRNISRELRNNWFWRPIEMEIVSCGDWRSLRRFSGSSSCQMLHTLRRFVPRSVQVLRFLLQTPDQLCTSYDTKPMPAMESKKAIHCADRVPHPVLGLEETRSSGIRVIRSETQMLLLSISGSQYR